MLESLYVILPIAVLLGFLSGLGTGGGSLLILWLTLVLDMPQAEARSINLMFFIPSALIACIFRWKQGSLDFKTVLPAIVAGCAAAGICGWFFADHNSMLLRKIFGILLVFTGIRELFYKKTSR